MKTVTNQSATDFFFQYFSALKYININNQSLFPIESFKKKKSVGKKIRNTEKKSNMFWAAVIKPGLENAHFTQPPEGHCTYVQLLSFPPDASPDAKATLSLQKEVVKLSIGTIAKGISEFIRLDLVIPKGESLSLVVEGNTEVHVSGIYVGVDDSTDDEEELEDDEDELIDENNDEPADETS
jgi:hypothetical protein